MHASTRLLGELVKVHCAAKEVFIPIITMLNKSSICIQHLQPQVGGWWEISCLAMVLGNSASGVGSIVLPIGDYFSYSNLIGHHI